jgi:hypothetical protein
VDQRPGCDELGGASAGCELGGAASDRGVLTGACSDRGVLGGSDRCELGGAASDRCELGGASGRDELGGAASDRDVLGASDRCELGGAASDGAWEIGEAGAGPFPLTALAMAGTAIPMPPSAIAPTTNTRRLRMFRSSWFDGRHRLGDALMPLHAVGGPECCKEFFRGSR